MYDPKLTCAFFVLLVVLCLAYFIGKGLLKEGWSVFAFLWAAVFSVCGYLTYFPVIKTQEVIYVICLAAPITATVDYLVIMGEKSRFLLITSMVVCCSFLVYFFS